VALADKGGVVGVMGNRRILKDVVDDIDCLINLVGRDHVGLGTDYGMGNLVLSPSTTAQTDQRSVGTDQPDRLIDLSTEVIDLARVMLARGHSAETVKRILQWL
jgi:microsomal dipeptidase-like Zn-dependent dipeptidase